jgi:hypothetical protein
MRDCLPFLGDGLGLASEYVQDTAKGQIHSLLETKPTKVTRVPQRQREMMPPFSLNIKEMS